MASASIDSSASLYVPIMSPNIAIEQSDTDWLFESVPTSLDRESNKVTDTTTAEVVQPSPAPPMDSIEEIPATADIDTGNVQESAPEQDILSTDPVMLGRGQRVRLPSIKLKDYVNYNASCIQDTHLVPHCALSSSSANDPGMTICPFATYIFDAAFSPVHRAFLAAVS